MLGEVVALDGKALRRAYERGHAASPPLTVSAFATATRLCLGAATPRPGENEVEAALKVVELIDLMVESSHDACIFMPMAEALVDGGAGYVLALKGNRRHWRRRAEELFAQSTPLESAQERPQHGPRSPADWLPQSLMPGHAAFVRITTQRDKAKPLTRLFMASSLFTPQQARHHRVHGRSQIASLDVDVLLERTSVALTGQPPADTAPIARIARNSASADLELFRSSHPYKTCAWNAGDLICTHPYA